MKQYEVDRQGKLFMRRIDLEKIGSYTLRVRQMDNLKEQANTLGTVLGIRRNKQAVLNKRKGY